MEWLRRARSNLAKARADRDVDNVLYKDLCFDAQQAAEKAVKALLVKQQIPFPKTHDIIDLLTLLQKEGIDTPDEIRQAGILTEYAVDARYPGLSEDVSKEEYLEAVELAERIFRWIETLISHSNNQELGADQEE